MKYASLYLKDNAMTELSCGVGPLFTDPDPDIARAFFKNKPRTMKNKVMLVRDAVSKHVADGDYLCSGGFGTNRISTAVLHEIVRQKKRNLGFAGHTATHDFQILAAGNMNGHKLISRVDIAYIVGLEARGLSSHARRIMQSGQVEICEWTNYALACRLRAAAMGVPFLPARNMMGTDTFVKSAAREISCPFTKHKLVAVPALYPDVAVIHVHESDVYGNCRIKGISVADVDLARASKKVIITTERIISNDDIRSNPHSTLFPSLYVDAVCEVPFGSYPGNMAGEYFSDERHLGEWLSAESDEHEFEAFIKKYILDLPDFEAYLEKCGGLKRIRQLRNQELCLVMEG